MAIKQLKCNCGNEQYKQGDWGTDDNVYSCVQYADPKQIHCTRLAIGGYIKGAEKFEDIERPFPFLWIPRI